MQITGCHGRYDKNRLAELEESEREFFAFEAEFCLGILAKRPYYLDALQAGAHALTHLGFYDDGLILDRRLASLQPKDSMVVYNLACSLALSSNVDDAFDTLQRAIDLGYRDADHLVSDPDLDNLRNDPRFTEVIERAHHFEDCPEV